MKKPYETIPADTPTTARINACHLMSSFLKTTTAGAATTMLRYQAPLGSDHDEADDDGEASQDRVEGGWHASSPILHREPGRESRQDNGDPSL